MKNQECPKRYWYEIIIIQIVLKGKITTSCSFHAISKLLFIINFYLEITSRTPTHTTELNWIHKIGYHLLMQDKPTADDWIIILDHSIQLGNKKIFLVYGIRESDINFDKPLKLEDLTPLVLMAKEKWDGEIIKNILLELENKIGKIKYAVADHGSDIKKGLELGSIIHIHDITHKIALILEAIYKNDSEYIEFTTKMSELRNKLSQTKNAFIIPPKQKTKSRYQNIKIISDWGIKIINCIKKNKITDNELYEKLKWVLDYENFILELDKLNTAICKIEKIIKSKGLSKDTLKKSQKIINQLKYEKAKMFIEKLNNYFNNVIKQIPDTKSILCCSDVIESAFGKYKNYVSSNPMAGVTNLILCLSAFTTKLTELEIKTALENTPINKIREWSKNEIGDTLLKRRKMAFSAV